MIAVDRSVMMRIHGWDKNGGNMIEENAVTFNILFKKVNREYIAHCLELDIVAVAPTLEDLKTDILDLIRVQIQYAFSNDNLEFLYHPAPSEVWQEFYSCRKRTQEQISMGIQDLKTFVPPWIIANTCMIGDSCHVE